MTRAVRRILQLICSFALVIASVPVAASEAVCVMPQQRMAVPMSECGMPCCAHPAKVLSSCCKEKHEVAACDPSGASAQCHSQTGCRCELRIYAASSPTVAPLHRVAKEFSHPLAILAAPVESVAVNATNQLQPGFDFSDSGPPIRIPYAPDLGRAPPAA